MDPSPFVRIFICSNQGVHNCHMLCHQLLQGQQKVRATAQYLSMTGDHEEPFMYCACAVFEHLHSWLLSVSAMQS